MKIVIVGGGTSGWIVSLLCSLRKDLEITTIASSQIPTIGVGEAVTGRITDLFVDQRYGLDEWEFIKKAKALPKYGIRFIDWNKQMSTFDSPIEGSMSCNEELDYLLYTSILLGGPIEFASRSGAITKADKVNFMFMDDQMTFKGDRTYHIDAQAAADYFKEKSILNGVDYIDAKVIDVTQDEDGIKSILLDDGREVEADFFIDCSGFSRVLYNKLDGSWESYEDYLPTNNALIFKLEKERGNRYPVSIAIARNNGWQFEIPTRYRIGRGYIYSDKFASREDIIQELEDAYEMKINVVHEIKFKNGRVKNAWVKNCLCLGLSSSFMEPLQATALHTTVVNTQTFLKDYPSYDKKRTINPVSIKHYNKKFAKMCDDLRDFVQVTYTGGRTDTEFWRYMTNECKLSDRVKDIIELAKTRLTRMSDFERYDGFAGQAIWNYTLAGLGYFEEDVIENTLLSYGFNIEKLKEMAVEVYEQNSKFNFWLLTQEELNDALKFAKVDE